LTFKPLCEVVKKHFHPLRVLDVGCAKGSLVYAFRATGIEAFGVDVSSYAISCAPKTLRSFLSKVDLDKERLPFNDNYFDLITFFGSIEYLHNHKHTIAEIERVLVNGGSLLMTTLYKRSKKDIYRINIHNKAFWIKQFNPRWIIPKSYYYFMASYFLRNKGNPCSSPKKLMHSLFGKSKLSDFVLVSLWDILVNLRVLNYGVLLFTLQKK
jgi:ubiquinone/menaquinone biosynthesis C-methylase UbiE